MKMRSYYLGELTWLDVKDFKQSMTLLLCLLEAASNMVLTCPLTPMPMMLFDFPYRLLKKINAPSWCRH